MAKIVFDPDHSVRFADVSAISRPSDKTLILYLSTGSGLQTVQWEWSTKAECDTFYNALMTAMNT